MFNRSVLAALLLFGAAGARAQPAPKPAPAKNADAAAPLTVTPPAGYVATPVAPRPGQGARFEVKLPTDADTGCQVAYAPTDRNKRFTQEQLDATMRAPQWQDAARKALSNTYDVRDSGMIEGEATGAAFGVAADFKERAGLPARARDVRTLFIIRETPRGRTSTVCVGDKADFDARRPAFVAVAAGAKGG